MRKQLGLSLIELLIAMFIGLFLLAGISSSYIYSKKSSIYNDQFSMLEDNGRLALEIMSKTIQLTGYSTNKAVPLLPNKFILSKPVSTTCSGSDNSVINTNFPDDSTIDSAADGDRIGVIYLGNSEITTDCSGETLPDSCQIGSANTTNSEAAQIFSTFYLLDNAKNELICVGSRDTEELAIAEGVENMQIMYGINTDDSPDRSVERYVNANDIAGLWNNVTSVQIALLVRSEKEVLDTAESKKFTLLDEEVTTPSDRYQRAVFTTTVSLRN